MDIVNMKKGIPIQPSEAQLACMEKLRKKLNKEVFNRPREVNGGW